MLPTQLASPCYGGFRNPVDGCPSNRPSLWLSVRTRRRRVLSHSHLLSLAPPAFSWQHPDRARFRVFCVGHTTGLHSWWGGWGNQIQTLAPVKHKQANEQLADLSS